MATLNRAAAEALAKSNRKQVQSVIHAVTDKLDLLSHAREMALEIPRKD